MLRYVIARPSLLSSKARQITRCLSTHRGANNADEAADVDAARKWLANLDADTIRDKAACDISFSRSSGPGGQNVNK